MQNNKTKKEKKSKGGTGLLVTEFLVGGAAFGIDARLVLEVVKVGDLTPVHGAPHGVVGIRNLRGRIVTVVDMAIHLNIGTVISGPDTRLLIMEHEGEPFGFLVDAVTHAISLDEDGLGEAPAGLDKAMRNRLIGVWSQDGHLTAILNAQMLFTWHEESA